MTGKKKEVPAKALAELRSRLQLFPARGSQRRQIIAEAAALYGVSESTLYRSLREEAQPKNLRRSDHGTSRVLPPHEMQKYCELISAIKVRTSNKKGRCLSTPQAIRLLETSGIETPDGLVKVPAGLLKPSTVNRHLKNLGLGKNTLLNFSAPATRFEAAHSNDCWQFDITSSDLKHVKEPLWLKEEKGRPLLMIYSVVDDRSGFSYQEYRCSYGEDAESALRFLFNAMSKKNQPKENPFHGIPKMIYLDNGPIAKSHVFLHVMKQLNVEVRVHMPQSSARHKSAARAKGKVERPFRTVKEMQETLYHFHEPKTEAEANEWLATFLIRYNNMQHRSCSHSRLEDWLSNAPKEGIQTMCSWERFCQFAREPERRLVDIDCTISVNGIAYEVCPDLTGEEVIVWWSLFDTEVYVEHKEKKYGPYRPKGGPIPLNRYRSFKKTKKQKKVEEIEALSTLIQLPREALTGQPEFCTDEQTLPAEKPFTAPNPFDELHFPDAIAAKVAIADYLGKPLAKLAEEDLAVINTVFDLPPFLRTLNYAQTAKHSTSYGVM